MSKQYVTVTAFIPWENRALLLQRATHKSFLPNYWEQAGGKVEHFENPTDAVVREVLEETSLRITPQRPYYVHDYKHSNGRHAVEIAILCTITSKPEVALSSAHQAYRWVTDKELAALMPMSDSMRQVVQEGFLVR